MSKHFGMANTKFNILQFGWRNWEKRQKFFLIACLRVEDWTRDLLNMNQKLY